MEERQDLISRRAAIDAAKDWYDGLICGSFRGLEKRLKSLPSAQPQQTCEYWDSESKFCALCRPSAQPEPSTEIQEILNYLDTTLHPIVSPDNWYVYAELHDMVSMLPSAQSEIVRCKDCRYDHDCNIQYHAQAGDDFYCGAAERRTDEGD